MALAVGGLKRCSRCQETKTLDEFHSDKRAKDSLMDRCKPCQREQVRGWRSRNRGKHRSYTQRWKKDNPDAHRDRRLQNDYGITLADYDRMKENQGGVCAICDKEAKLHVDHCHVSGVVRGLLCHKCNIGLGQLGDNVEGLRRALAYLESPALR